jgi:hypothetical protein
MTKEKKTKQNKSQAKLSRAKYKCPPELKELIELTNLVPNGIITPDFENEIRIELKRLRDETGDPSPEISAYEFLTSKIKHLPKEFLDYLDREAYRHAFPFEITPESYEDERRFRQEFVKQYVEYCSMRGSMLWLVRRLEDERKSMRSAEKEYGLEENSLTFQHYTSLDWDAFPISINTTLLRDDSGTLHITGLAALIGKFDDSRLRRCNVCERIFWAKRKDSETCSLSCFNILRQRRHREKNKAALNAKRRENYQYKKKKNGIVP